MPPRIRTANRFPPPWPLNEFPAGFAVRVASEIIAHLAVDSTGAIEGPMWERMFATAIGADWKPSNVGLDDVVLRDAAWGAKTVKNSKPHTATTVRLISGRNSPDYSFGKGPKETETLGKMVLEIWNARAAALKRNYRHLRSVVLLKPSAMTATWLDYVVFEFDTIPFDTTEFRWALNDQENLEGWHRESNEHWFTWQPHGSQFTIIHKVPTERLKFQVKRPAPLDAARILDVLEFEESWIRVI